MEYRNGLAAAEDAFRLYDTHGFQIDLIKELAAERGFTVDEEGFNLLMEKHRQQSREARRRQ